MSHLSSEHIARRTLEIIPFVMRVMAAEMRTIEGGVAPSQVAVLTSLRLRPYNLSDLADRHAVSRPTMSNTVKVLEARGWLRRVKIDPDRRLVQVEISDEGLDILVRIESQVMRRIAHFLTDLSEEQLTMLVDGLTVLRDTFAHGLDVNPMLGD